MTNMLSLSTPIADAKKLLTAAQQVLEEAKGEPIKIRNEAKADVALQQTKLIELKHQEEN